MSILVTGGTGFLGTALVRRLVAAGHAPVRVLLRPDRPAPRATDDRIDYFRGSLDSAADAAAALADASVVYHLAAAKSGTAADMFRGTLATSRHLLDAIRAAPRPPRVVLVSSFGVYGTAGLEAGARIDEQTPLEASPARRDVYSHAKLMQERMFRDAHARHGMLLVVLRPGVIYGPGSPALPTRVGIGARGLFLALGGTAPLPLTYVDNCADALIRAAESAPVGGILNVVDDDLPTCAEYLRAYRASVRGLRVIAVPHPVLAAGSRALDLCRRLSGNRLPAVLPPYIVHSMYRPFRYGNDALKAIGWRQSVATADGMERTFSWLCRTKD